jgi:hypothetical protein
MVSYSSNSGRKRNSGARTAAWALAVLVAGTLLTACSENDTKPRPTAPVPPPATIASPSPETQARADVLVVYNRAQVLFELVQKNGRIGDEYVLDTMTDKARGQWASAGLRYQEQGIRLDGSITRAPTVTAVDMAGAPPSATVVDCIDISAAKVVDTTTGTPKKTAEGQSLRYIQTTSLIRDNGRWLVSDVLPERGRAC